MKKYFLTSVIFFTAFNSFSQKIEYGIKAGVNISNFNGYSGGPGIGSLTTFQAGGIANIFVSDIFFVEPELLFSGKGSTSVRLYYLEFPLNIMFKERFETGNLNFGFGPYAGIGIGGKIDKYNYNGNEPVFTVNKIKFGNSANDDFKKTDFGLNFKAGFQFDMGIFASLNYSLGLMNITPPVATFPNVTSSLINHYFGFSAGYIFKGKKK